MRGETMISYEPAKETPKVASDRGGVTNLRLTSVPRPDLDSRDSDMRVWVKSLKDTRWVSGVSMGVFVHGEARIETGLVLHLVDCYGTTGTTTTPDDVIAKYSDTTTERRR
jgi:hypothetical protein